MAIADESAYIDIVRACNYARDLIASCERALHRKLSRGECNDLLCDNTRWTRSEIVAVMDSIRGVN